MRAVEPVSAVGLSSVTEQGDVPSERHLAADESDEDREEEVSVEGHNGQHEEVGDEGLQAKEERTRQVDRQ